MLTEWRPTSRRQWVLSRFPSQLDQLSLSDRRLFNFLLAHAYPNLGRRPNYAVRLSDIRGFAALARDGTGEADNRRLKSSIERLQKTLVTFNYLDSDKGTVWQSSQLLGTCILAERTGGEAAVGQKPRAPTHDRREQAAIGH